MTVWLQTQVVKCADGRYKMLQFATTAGQGTICRVRYLPFLKDPLAFASSFHDETAKYIVNVNSKGLCNGTKT
jgi:hypothetical protein